MATGTKRDCRGVNCWRQLYRPIASTGDAALARHRIRDPVIPASSAPHRSSAAAAGSDATATATDSKDASRNSSARAFAAPACRSLGGVQTWVGGITLAHTCSG